MSTRGASGAPRWCRAMRTATRCSAKCITPTRRHPGQWRQDTGIEGERAQERRDKSIAGEKLRALERERPTMAGEESDQRTPHLDNDVPDRPPDPRKSPDRPTERPRREEVPPSVELKGERSGHVSCDVGNTRAEAASTAMSEGADNARHRPKVLQNVLEHGDDRVERQEGRNSLQSAEDKPGELEAEADASPAMGGNEDPRTRPKKLQEVSKCVSEQLERGEVRNSPMKAPDDADELERDPDALNLAPGKVPPNTGTITSTKGAQYVEV